MNDQTDYVSSQSECSDGIHELEDTNLDNPKLDDLYQCNVTGVCQVSYKPTAYYNLIVLTSWLACFQKLFYTKVFQKLLFFL